MLTHEKFDDRMQSPGRQPTLYCKSTNFGMLLYLANCVFSLIFVAANIYVDRTLRRRAAERRQINVNHYILRNAKFYSRQNLLIYSTWPNV